LTSKNTDNYIIDIVNTQTIDKQSEKISSTSHCSFRLTDNKAYIVYKNEGCTNMIKTEGDTVFIKRSGDTGYEMHCKKNCYTNFDYNTPYGTIKMRIFTNSVKCILTPDGGSIYLNYLLETGGDKIYNNMEINIRR
jgi:uncharacterized beta-barrel protein YwiB (DUF1934 family)